MAPEPPDGSARTHVIRTLGGHGVSADDLRSFDMEGWGSPLTAGIENVEQHLLIAGWVVASGGS